MSDQLTFDPRDGDAGTGPDPLLAMIAEHERLYNLASVVEDKADKLWLAAPRSKRDFSYGYIAEDIERNTSSFSPKRRAEIQAKFAAEEERAAKEKEACGATALYCKVKELQGDEKAIYDTIVATKATTIAGVIEQVRFIFSASDIDSSEADIVAAGLRDIEARLSRPAAPAIDLEDPVIALIAEENRIRCAAIKLSDAADSLRWALPEARQRELKDMEEKSFPGEMGVLYRQSEPLYEEADKLLDRIRETKPITFVGAIALLENGVDDHASALLKVSAFLRYMQAKGGAQLEILRGHNEDPGNLDVLIATARNIEVSMASSAAAPDDSRILSLFREWVAARRAADVLCGEDGNSAEYKASAEATEKIESALIEVPSKGAAGFAIKSYLALHADGGDYDDGAALGNFALNWEVDAAILKDAIRFVPELAPLAARALAAQPDEPEDAEPEGSFGEPDEGVRS